MIKIIKKKEHGPIDDRITFSATGEQRLEINKIKEADEWDINAIYREVTDDLIRKWKARNKSDLESA